MQTNAIIFVQLLCPLATAATVIYTIDNGGSLCNRYVYGLILRAEFNSIGEGGLVKVFTKLKTRLKKGFMFFLMKSQKYENEITIGHLHYYCMQDPTDGQHVLGHVGRRLKFL